MTIFALNSLKSSSKGENNERKMELKLGSERIPASRKEPSGNEQQHEQQHEQQTQQEQQQVEDLAEELAEQLAEQHAEQAQQAELTQQAQQQMKRQHQMNQQQMKQQLNQRVHLHDQQLQVNDQEVQSSETTKKNASVGRWTQEEHAIFLQGLQKYGKSWKKISQMIPTRTLVQIRTHAQKYLQKKQWHDDANNRSKIGVKRASPYSMHQPMFFPMVDPFLLGSPVMLHPPRLHHTLSQQDLTGLDDLENFDLDSLLSTNATPNDQEELQLDSFATEFDKYLNVDDSLDWLSECSIEDFDVPLDNNNAPRTPVKIAPLPTPDESGLKKRRLQPTLIAAKPPGMDLPFIWPSFKH